MSARYSEMPEECWTPEPTEVRGQGSGNKQVANGGLHEDVQAEAHNAITKTYDQIRSAYRKLLDLGVGREQARTVLPMGQYTEAYVTANLGDWLLFLKQRLNPHAQYEIRVYAEKVYEILLQLFPVTMQAFMDYQVNGVKMSAQELETIRYWLNNSEINGHELAEPGCEDYSGVNLPNLRDNQRKGWLGRFLPTRRERQEFWKKITK